MPAVASNRRSTIPPRRNDPAASTADSAIRAVPSHTVNPPWSRHSSAHTARRPRNKTTRRMACVLNVRVARQNAARIGHGSATANHTTRQTEHDHSDQIAAARRDATISSRLHGAAQCCVTGIFGDIARNEITRDVGVRQFEKFYEGRAFGAGRERESISQEPQQQEIELLHTAPATPFELPQFDLGRHLLMLPLDHHLLDLGNRLGRIQVLRAGLGAIHDGVAAIQPERVFEIVESFAGRFVA
jgi:hypothetical protein